jgi:hypothetical protein
MSLLQNIEHHQNRHPEKRHQTSDKVLAEKKSSESQTSNKFFTDTQTRNTQTSNKVLAKEKKASLEHATPIQATSFLPRKKSSKKAVRR